MEVSHHVPPRYLEMLRVAFACLVEQYRLVAREGLCLHCHLPRGFRALKSVHSAHQTVHTACVLCQCTHCSQLYLCVRQDLCDACDELHHQIAGCTTVMVTTQKVRSTSNPHSTCTVPARGRGVE